VTAKSVVLVVDDDDLVRKVVRAVLEADDYEVREASSGELALQMLKEDQPALVILDVMMPGLDGVEVCRQMEHDGSRVLMLTARDDVETEDASRAAGADDFLGKPFSSLELLDHVKKLVGS
jgi:DNA-binding response OmpR family regulator